MRSETVPHVTSTGEAERQEPDGRVPYQEAARRLPDTRKVRVTCLCCGRGRKLRPDRARVWYRVHQARTAHDSFVVVPS